MATGLEKAENKRGTRTEHLENAANPAQPAVDFEELLSGTCPLRSRAETITSPSLLGATGEMLGSHGLGEALRYSASTALSGAPAQPGNRNVLFRPCHALRFR